VLPPLAAPTVAPAAGGLARAAPVGAALLGAAALGLAIGNGIYEEVLDRPFGPSLGDLLFPVAQPVPVPITFPEISPLLGMSIYYVDGFGSNTGAAGTPVLDYEIVGSNPHVPGPGIRMTFCNGSVDTGSYQAGTIRVVSYGACSGLYEPSPQPELEPVYQPRALPTLEPLPGTRPYLPGPLRLPEVDPLRMPTRIPTPTRTQPFIPRITPERLPESQPLPGPLISPSFLPVQRPELFPALVIDPQLELNRERQRTRRPPTPQIECCPSLELKLDKLIDRDECEPCDLSEVENLLREVLDKISDCDNENIEDLLQRVLDKLAVAGSGGVDLTPCDSEEETIAAYQGEGIQGIFEAITAITESLNLIHADTRCPPENCVVAVPDWWQMRPGANRPQLSVIFRKGDGRNYHAINIPHPRVSPPPTASPLSAYTAGNFQATIVLIDNSKFIVNAVTAAEANRVALEAADAIQPVMLGSEIKISITERRGYPVSVDVMEPRYMQYFPEGQQSRMPEWRVSFSP